ncbi:type II toxin-antitoxin system RelE/ParE family toxin [Silvibacterium acidisoli]|uniref:type II toxin-antitoxin system RelE/ParE family toxin n=1 Tax=Acidobacteriaceae bacterium ZG23-2 TaxID=2883246 RepID=UPI00406CA5C8
MTARAIRKTLQITTAAASAIVEQADFYDGRSDSIAHKWEEAVHAAIRSLLTMPDRGARCHFTHPQLQAMRRIPVPGFPQHLIFYRHIREENLVLIVHVLHGARDIEELLGNLEGE